MWSVNVASALAAAHTHCAAAIQGRGILMYSRSFELAALGLCLAALLL